MKIDIKRLIEDKEYCETVFKHYLKIKVLRETDIHLFGKYLNRAVSNLEFANFIFGEHGHSIKEKLPGKTFYDWCITIYYYAIYHTTLALAAKIGYESKSHLATIATVILFYYHRDNILNKGEIELIVEKIHLEKEEIDFVLNSKSLRERACYKVDELFELRQAKSMQEQTADFVSRIRPLLEE